MSAEDLFILSGQSEENSCGECMILFSVLRTLDTSPPEIKRFISCTCCRIGPR